MTLHEDACRYPPEPQLFFLQLRIRLQVGPFPSSNACPPPLPAVLSRWGKDQAQTVWKSPTCDAHTALIKNDYQRQYSHMCIVLEVLFLQVHLTENNSISPTKQTSPNYLFLLWVSSLYLTQETHWKLATAGSLVYGQLEIKDIETTRWKQEKAAW